MGSGKKAIPDRWLDYSTLGRQIPRTRIVCFKVPLKKEICNSLPEKQRFTPDMLMKALPNLVGVVDVTNTPRYYNKQEFMKYGIRHEKILCPGHSVPPLNVINKFQNVMNCLWDVADSLDKLVGVHCTHGVNRTGYLVCRYLIECRGFQPEEAIKLFGESRGHPIERQNYLNDLMTLKPKQASKTTSHDGVVQSGFQNQGIGAHAEARWQRNFSSEPQNLYQHTAHASNSPHNHHCPENRQNYRHSDFYPPTNSRGAHLYDSQVYPMENVHSHGYPMENARSHSYPIGNAHFHGYPMENAHSHSYPIGNAHFHSYPIENAHFHGYPIENAHNHPSQHYASSSSSRSPQSHHPEQGWSHHFQPLQPHHQFSRGKPFYQD